MSNLLDRRLRILPFNGSMEEFEVIITGTCPGRNMDLTVAGSDAFGAKWTHIQYDGPTPESIREQYLTTVQFHGYLCRFGTRRDHLEIYFTFLPEEPHK